MRDYNNKHDVTNTHFNEKGDKANGRTPWENGVKTSMNSFYAELNNDFFFDETTFEEFEKKNEKEVLFKRHDALVHDGGKDIFTSSTGKQMDLHSHLIADVTFGYEYSHGPNAEIPKDEWDLLLETEIQDLVDYKENNIYEPYKDNSPNIKEAEAIADRIDKEAYSFSPEEIEVEIHNCDYCSWHYHGRCLKGNHDGYGCIDYTTEEHTCSNCSCFEDCPGENRKGDRWYGICNAYGGNPIRHDPSSHTCKAWN